MKKFIRGLIKIPLTPFAVGFCVFGIVAYYIVLFVQWLYDFDDWDKHITKECIKDFFKALKEWFTTI
jgi:hypothetical protein